MEEKIIAGEQDIKVGLIDRFPDHPYHVLDDVDMEELAASIQANALLSPKIDRILVKSVSRFARNSLECIEAVRELKRYDTTVLFENDGIDSNTMNHELALYITIISR